MVLEEQQQRCSNSSSGGAGGRPSKKLKQKKIPQRGLGVAQLEKIRLEEQQKKDPSSFVPPLPHHYHQSSSSSTPFPPPFPTDPPSSNSLFRQTPSIPNFDLFNPTPPLPTPTTLYAHTSSNPLGGGGGGGGSVMGGSPMMVPGQGYIPTIWTSSDFNRDAEGTKLDPGLVYRPHLPNYSNPISTISTLPVVIQRKQYQYQPSLMVNVSSATSSSSGLNFQMEPPSNQNNSNHTPLWSDEEKMVGIKRPYPFSLDNPQGPSIHCKFARSGPLICGWDESSSYGSGGTFNLDSEKAIFREGSSCPTPLPLQVEWSRRMSGLNPVKGAKENGALDLTLGLPEHSAFPTSHYGDFQDFLPFQKGSIEDPLLQPGTVRSVPLQPFYSFLPPKVQIDQETTTSSDTKGEAGDTVDLNLKL